MGKNHFLKNCFGMSYVAMLVFLQGCHQSYSSYVMKFDDYIAMLPKDAKCARTPFVFGNDRDFRRLYWWSQSDKDEWAEAPLWVVAEVCYFPLGNHEEILIDVKCVSAYLTCWFMCADAKAYQIVLGDFSPLKDNKLWKLLNDFQVPPCTGVFCALKILPTRENLGGSRAVRGCKVEEAFLIDSFHNRMFEAIMRSEIPAH